MMGESCRCADLYVGVNVLEYLVAWQAHRAEVAAALPANHRSIQDVSKHDPHHFRTGITHILVTFPASSVQRAPRPRGWCHPEHAGLGP
jgi:hypothetical protein